MRGILIALLLALLASVAHAQRASELSNDAYKALAEVRDVQVVLKSEEFNRWWSERRKTREHLSPQIPEFGKTIGIADLTYESLFNRYVPRGYAAEIALYGDNKQEFAGLLVNGEGADRQAFVEAMRLVEYQDVLILSAFNRTKPESIFPLRSWVIIRAAFGLDINAKRLLSGASKSSLSSVTVRTFYKSTSNEVSGYEVVYVPAFWRGVPSKERVFPKISSPTSHPMRAGHYFIRCRKTEKGEVVEGPERSIDVDQPNLGIDIRTP